MAIRRTQVKAKLLLIDGNNLFHRAYHALPPLTDKSGENANAVYGFSNMLIKAINEVKPTYIACAFDTAAPTFRHIEFEKYKAQRPAPPPDLYPQLPKVKRVLEAFGIPFFEKEGYEADDLLATLATKALKAHPRGVPGSGKAHPGGENSVQVVILSGDRDVLQLVDGDIKVQMPFVAVVPPLALTRGKQGKPGWGILMGAKEVREKYGLEPHQMVDYKSLIGDSSDNIPGIAGIGPKTAASLLLKFHTLEELFEQLGKNPGSLGNVAEKLKSGHDVAIAAKRLVELDRDVDIKFDISNLVFRPDWDQVRAEYEDLGFKSIAAKLPGSKEINETDEPKVTKKRNDDQLKLIEE